MGDHDKSRIPRWSRRALGCAVFLSAQLLAATPGFCEIVLLRPKKDSTLIQNTSGALANGSGSAIFSGRTNAGSDSIRRALLAFDLSMIPTGSQVTKAVLSLNLSATSAGPVAIQIRRVTADWGEGASLSPSGGGAPSSEGDSTWVHRFYDQALWTHPGGDFDSKVIATATVDQPGIYLWNTNEAMVGEVQAWLDHPEANFGWILVGDESRPTTEKRFDSRETPDEANRPILYVEYTAPRAPNPLGPDAQARRHAMLFPEAAAGGIEIPEFVEAILRYGIEKAGARSGGRFQP